MAFLAALPEIAEAAGGAAEAGGAAGAEAGGSAAEAGSEGMPSMSPKAPQLPGDQGKQQNVGESRTGVFQQAAMGIRSALRGGGGGVD